MRLIIGTIFLVLCFQVEGAGDWRYSETIRLLKGGTSLEIVCSSISKDLDLARFKAIEKCKLGAADQFVLTYNFLKIERKAGSNQSNLGVIERKKTLRNLNCHPLKDFYDGEKYWVKCLFSDVLISDDPLKLKPESKEVDGGSVVTQLAIRPSCSQVYVLGEDVVVYPCRGSFVNILREKKGGELIVVSNKLPYRLMLKRQEEDYGIQRIDLWDN